MTHDLTIVVPTLNEASNIEPLLARLDAALEAITWEVIFVDDDSTDGTAEAVRAAAARRDNVRLIVRVGRRGLSTAAIEGMMASTAPFLAVMDGDLQHDEAVLPDMLKRAREKNLDIVVASRFADTDSPEGLSIARRLLSRIGNALSRTIAKAELSDPLTGFFLLRQSFRDEVVHDLSGAGFKILLDIFASARRPLAFEEVPMRFRERHSGESKLDATVMIAFAGMIVDKVSGRILPVAYMAMTLGVLFSVGFHVAVLSIMRNGLGMPFTVSQVFAGAICLTVTLVVGTRFSPHPRMGIGGLAGGWLAAAPGLITNIWLAMLLDKAGVDWVIAGTSGALLGALATHASRLALARDRRA
jgi:dolichol-phosphate mannosyltransferase